MLALLALGFILALHPGPAHAQSPPVNMDDFEFVPEGRDSLEHDRVVPRRDATEDGGAMSPLCRRYTYGAPWRRPMQLYLGEGARDGLAVIKRAVQIWNDALPGKVIELREELVSYPHGGSPFTAEGRRYYGDGVSVIYLLNGEEVPSGGRAGYATSRFEYRNGLPYEITESDIFVWPPRWPETGEIYLDNLRFLGTTAHEIGHGLGLKHITLSANLMSYGSSSNVVDRLEPFSMLNLFPEHGPGPWQPIFWGHLFGDRNHLNLFFKSVVPGAQDKLALSCLYSEWTGE